MCYFDTVKNLLCIQSIILSICSFFITLLNRFQCFSFTFYRRYICRESKWWKGKPINILEWWTNSNQLPGRCAMDSSGGGRVWEISIVYITTLLLQEAPSLLYCIVGHPNPASAPSILSVLLEPHSSEHLAMILIPIWAQFSENCHWYDNS